MRLTHKRFTPPTILSTAIVSLILAGALGGQAMAASACKGLAQEVCETSQECRWQAGYTRKDGIEVASHCRSTGKKKADVPMSEPTTQDAPTEINAEASAEATS
ncbi:MAG: hypothetical protein EOM91_01590 [Sphingobacteriia bacterium]|nr:hypothetical protein [Sphingobacteriia bacterium]NCC39330.1 hypothetical protein [Gammaproteobacteria bacterium]